MLSASDIHSIKTGGRLATALSQNRDDIVLKRTLGAIENEKIQRLREIEIRRKQFLLHHRGAKCSSATEFQKQCNVERQLERIQAEKVEENRCQTSLDKRKTEFLDTLISRPFTSRVPTRNENIDEKEAIALEHLAGAAGSPRERSPDSQFKLPSYELKSRALHLYQRSFGAIKRQRQQRVSPFAASVNTILDQLRGKGGGGKKFSDTEEQSNKLTRHILGKYAGIDMVNSDEKRPLAVENISSAGSSIGEYSKANGQDGCHDEMNKRSNQGISVATSKLHHTDGKVSESESERMRGTSENDKGEMQPMNSQNETDSDSSESSDDLSTIHHSTSNKALQLWASVRKEQKLAKLHMRRRNTLNLKRKTSENKGDEVVSINVIPPSKTHSHSNPSYGPSQSAATSPIRSKRNSFVGDTNCDSRSTVRSTGSSAINSECESSKSLSIGAVKAHEYKYRQQDGKRSSLSNLSSCSSVTSDRRRASSIGTDYNGSKSSQNGKMHYLSPCQPMKNGVSRSKTVIIVHSDGGDETKKNKDMFSVKDSTHGSATDKQKTTEDNFDGDYQVQRTNAESNDIANVEKAEQMSDVSDNENRKNNDDLSVPGLNLCQTPTETDARSVSRPTVHSLSRVTSGIRKGKSAGTRRLSIQTSGALRMWTAVKRAESTHEAQKQDEDIHPDSQAYKNIIDDLAGAEAEEQAQRLETVRRASLSRVALNGKEGNVSLSASRRVSADTRVSFADNSYEETSDRRQARRNYNSVSHRRTSTDVTDEVYKFLQKKFSSNELRRMSLSTAEQTLLADGPGSENVARRNSVSSPLGSSRRSSTVTTDGDRRTSISLDFQKRCQSPKDLVSTMLGALGTKSRRNSNSGTPRGSLYSQTPPDDLSDTGSASMEKKQWRSYSWAPDVSHTRDWHILALEVLARNRTGAAKFRTVSHLLQCLADEYRHQTTAMMYEELRYCTYLRLPKRHMPEDLLDSDVSSVFN